MTGWTLAEAGNVMDGIEQVRAGLRDLRATGAQLRLPYFLWILAGLCRRAHRRDNAAEVLTEAWAISERTEEHWNDANLHQLAGELALDAGDSRAAESRFRRAVETASCQGSRSLALKASTRLARLLAESGRRREASDLALIYGSFTEGRDTPDLRDAAALLDALK
jgi:predicted ATPase